MLTILPTVYQVQLQFPLASLNSMNQCSHNSLSYFSTQNYGEFFDEGPEGIAGGPVELIDGGNTTTDLSSNEWSYKVNYMEAASSVWILCTLMMIDLIIYIYLAQGWIEW